MQCQKLKTYIESGRVVFLPPKIIRANPTQPRRSWRIPSASMESYSPSPSAGWVRAMSWWPESDGSGQRPWPD